MSKVSPKSLEISSPTPKQGNGNGPSSLSHFSAQSSSSPSQALSRNHSFSLSSPTSFTHGGAAGNSAAQFDAHSASSDSFWQQHPQLYNVCGFVIEYHNNACHERLRDTTRVIIRKFWSRAADIKAEVEGQVTGSSVNDFQAALNTDLAKVFTRSMKEAEVFLQDFLVERMSLLLFDLCSLGPCHSRVAKLGVFLIEKLIADQHNSLLNIFGLYTKRKLEEVCSLSVQQYKKMVVQYVASPSYKQITALPSDLYCSNSLGLIFGRLLDVFHMKAVDGGDEIERFNWISCMCLRLYAFEAKRTNPESLSEASYVALLNSISFVSIDLTDVIISLASYCSAHKRHEYSYAAATVHTLGSFLHFFFVLIRSLIIDS